MYMIVYDWNTENYPWRYANFQRFIYVTVYYTMVTKHINRCTSLLWCYIATIFLMGSNIPFTLWSWTWCHQCYTSDGFFAVSSFTFVHLHRKIVHFVSDHCFFLHLTYIQDHCLLLTPLITWSCSSKIIKQIFWPILSAGKRKKNHFYNLINNKWIF